MKFNYRTIAKITLTLSIISIIVGYFLWTILIPIQDSHLMGDTEILHAQQELALNYPLGRFLLYAGFIVFFLSFIYLVKDKVKKILIRLKKKIKL